MSDPVDALYERPPGEFVAARNQVAKDLRKAGDKHRAAEVAGLRRPTPAAWAVNQLARRHRSQLDALLRAGTELRSAQSEAVAGGDPDTLRQAARARREAVAGLTDTAVVILREQGIGAEAHRAAIAATLDAGSLDARAGDQVSAGRLATDLAAPSGFGDLDLPVLPDEAGTGETAGEIAGETAGEIAGEPAGGGDSDDAGAAAERVALYQARHEAEQRVRAAEHAARRAADREAAARHRLEKAGSEVEEAERALRAARRRQAEAAEDLAGAEAEAARSREALEEVARASGGADG